MSSRTVRPMVSPAIVDLERLNRSRLRLVGVVLLCLKVTIVPLAFDLGADVPFTVTKGLTAHALAYLLGGVTAGVLVLYGRSAFVWSPIHVPVVGFFAVAAASTLSAANTNLALFGAHVRMLGLGTIADGVVLYFAIVLLIRTRREAFAVVVSAFGAAVLVLLYEAIQFAGRDPFSWNAISGIRPFSTIGQTTTLAEYLTVLALGAATTALLEDRLPISLRGTLLGLAAIFVAGVVVTQTRAALIGVVAGTGLVVVLVWTVHPSRRTRIWSAVVGLAAVLTLGVLVAFTPLGARILGTVEVQGPDAAGEQGTVALEQSAATRLELYRIAFAMLEERPVLGYGPDNFSVGFQRYRTATEPTDIQQSLATSAHGWLAQLAATTGLLGVMTFCAAIVVALVLVFRKGFQPTLWACGAMLGGYLGAGITTIDDVSTTWLFWAALGGVAALSVSPGQNVSSAGRLSRRLRPSTNTTLAGLRPSGAGVCVLAGFVLAAMTWSALSASHQSNEALQARLSGRYSQAIALSLRAIASDGGRAEYWEGLGLGYVGAERFGEAVMAFQHANLLAPQDVRYLGEVARAYAVLAQRGDAAAGVRAREVADRGVQLDPNNPQSHLTRAVVMQATGNIAEAATSIDRALMLDPMSYNAALYRTATQVYNAAGRFSDAIRVGRQGVRVISLPATVAVRVEVARALLASGQPSEALAEIDAALATQPSDQTALQVRNEIRQVLQK